MQSVAGYGQTTLDVVPISITAQHCMVNGKLGCVVHLICKERRRNIVVRRNNLVATSTSAEVYTIDVLIITPFLTKDPRPPLSLSLSLSL